MASRAGRWMKKNMHIKSFKPKSFPENVDISNLRNIKFGIDPTFNRLHIGHLVPLAWLKHHLKKDITIILGTVTAQLGDPSGKDKTRPILSSMLVGSHADLIELQLRIILPEVRIVRQAPIDALELLNVSSNFTVTKLMSRDGFQKRESVGSHELMVPILQALDSVFLQTELELGGEDQLFNFELTREVQKLHGQKPEACLMFPIIRGTDGQKMSKSLGNCIWLDDPNIRQRIMSISDDVMDEWLPLFSTSDEAPDHPKERKEFLAQEICKLIGV